MKTIITNLHNESKKKKKGPKFSFKKWKTKRNDKNPNQINLKQSEINKKQNKIEN